jgi:ABC-type dipeptide/oligopeptide/nickel transport system permease component
MHGMKIINILFRYFLIFIGLTILLFIFYKLVPEAVIKDDFPGKSINILGIHENDLFQYFYFLNALLTGHAGYVHSLIYSGSVTGAVLALFPETVVFLVITFVMSYEVSYIIGFHTGTEFKTIKKLSMNIFPLLFLYLVSALTLLAVFSGLLGWFPFSDILSSSSLSESWISSMGSNFFISSPTDIILIDGIIHNSPAILIDYLKHIALPFMALFIPTTIYLSVYISHETSIEYNKNYIRAGITRDAFRDNYMLYIKRGIKPRILGEIKPVFLIFTGGMVLVSFIFSYMNLGEFAVYSFLNYDFGFMGGMYSLFILALIIIAFDIIIDMVNINHNPINGGEYEN